MSVAIRDNEIQIIGTEERALNFYDDELTLQASIYLKRDGSLNLPGTGEVTSGGGASLSSHALNGGIHTGFLSSAQAPQFALLNGSRAMTGDLDMGAQAITNVGNVDGVDVSDHSARHNPGGTDALATAAPGAIEPDDPVSAGSATSFARSDHQHAIAAAEAVTLTVATSDAEGTATSFARSDHTHAITTSSNPGAAASILASDANGRLELEGLGIGASPTGQELRLDGDFVFVGAQQITNTTGQLTIDTADDDLLLSPDGSVLTDSDLSADNWVSGTTGWGINYNGNADFRELTADELQVKAFVAEIYSALAGALIISESRARVSRDFTIPDTGNTATLYVEDHEGHEGTQVFSVSDYVLLRVIDTSGGGLVVADVWGQVTSYSDLAGGEQSWTFTTTTTGYSGSDTIYRGSVALDYGSTGSGVWEATVLDSAGAPYSQVQTWSGVTDGEPSGFTTHVRTGNLDGLSGVGAEYGLYAGQGLANGDQYILITDSQAELHNIDLTLHDGSNVVYKVDYSTPYYALGSSAPTAFDSGTGVWAGNDGGTYKWRVGDPSDERVEWDGAALNVVGTITADDGEIGGWTITSDQIYAGTNSPGGGSFTGMVLDSDGISYDGIGWNVAGVDDGTLQVGFRASDGALLAGGGNIILSADGLQIERGQQGYNAVTWTNSGAEYGSIYMFNDGFSDKFRLELDGSVQLDIDDTSGRTRIYTGLAINTSVTGMGSSDLYVGNDVRVSAGLYVGALNQNPGSGYIVATGGVSGWLPFTTYEVLPLNLSASANDNDYPFTATIGRSMTIESWHQAVYVSWANNGNNGSNYWLLRLYELDGTHIASVNTSSISAGSNEVLSTSGIDHSLDPSTNGQEAVYIRITAVGSPGNLWLHGPAVYVL